MFTPKIIRKCGHEEAIHLNEVTFDVQQQWLEDQKCLRCQPNMLVRRLCGHHEWVERTLADTSFSRIWRSKIRCQSCRQTPTTTIIIYS